MIKGEHRFELERRLNILRLLRCSVGQENGVPKLYPANLRATEEIEVRASDQVLLKVPRQEPVVAVRGRTSCWTTCRLLI